MCRYLKMAFAVGFALAFVVWFVALLYDEERGDMAVLLVVCMTVSASCFVILLRSLR